MRCAPPPLGSETQISESPDRDDENAILLPSLAHAGVRLLPPAPPPGKATVRPRSNENILIAHPSLPSDANASRELSGEMRGESEMLAHMRNRVLVCAVVVHHPDFFDPVRLLTK